MAHHAANQVVEPKNSLLVKSFSHSSPELRLPRTKIRPAAASNTIQTSEIVNAIAAAVNAIAAAVNAIARKGYGETGVNITVTT